MNGKPPHRRRKSTGNTEVLGHRGRFRLPLVRLEKQVQVHSFARGGTDRPYLLALSRPHYDQVRIHASYAVNP